RRVRCGGRDRQKRDTAYPGECRRSHISFPCVPPWVGKRRTPYLSEPHPDCQEGSHCLYGDSRMSCAAVSFHGFRSGMQQVCPEGPLIGCLPWGDSVKPWVPRSNSVCQ